MSLIGLQRKKRLTKQEVKEFAHWALTNDVYDKYTCGMISKMYGDECGVLVTESTVRAQKNRWIMIDDEIYDVNKPYLFPKSPQLQITDAEHYEREVVDDDK